MNHPTRAARRVASTCLLPLVRRAARAYVAGERLGDALRAASKFASVGVDATLGYWDGAGDTPRQVADFYLAAINSIQSTASGGGPYLSVKVTALGFSDELIGEVASAAGKRGVRLHMDAMAHDTVAATQRAAAAILDSQVLSPALLGYTLPGRWLRSLDDADWAAERQVNVRVVKGQWADPHAGSLDLREGFLQVIDRLSGRARHVCVATHDAPLAAEAIRRLRAAGTTCGLELLYGLPMQASLLQARQLGIPVRVYVPYGQAYLPYAMSHVRTNPSVFWWLIKDFTIAKTRALQLAFTAPKPA